MATINSFRMKTELGSARPFAAELGLLDFDKQLDKNEIACLLLAEYLEQEGMKPSNILAIMRWLSTQLANMKVGRRQEVISIVDKRWLVYVRGETAYDLTTHTPTTIGGMPSNPIEDVAISLSALYSTNELRF